jgi:predicted aconitase with swiveling domain
VTLKGRKIFGGTAQGEALVSKQGISLYGGVDFETGVITERRHELCGTSVNGKILVFPYGKGSTGWARGLFYLKENGVAPKALVVRELCEFVIVGAVTSEIPTICCLSKDPTEVIQTGMQLDVDANEGTLKIESTASL